MPIKYEVASASSIQNLLETIDFIENFKLFFYFIFFSKRKHFFDENFIQVVLIVFMYSVFCMRTRAR